MVCRSKTDNKNREVEKRIMAVTGLYQRFVETNIGRPPRLHKGVGWMVRIPGLKARFWGIWVVSGMNGKANKGTEAFLANRSALLKEWAYAGFSFDFLLAVSSSFVAGVPGDGVALFAILLLIVSRFYSDRVRNTAMNQVLNSSVAVNQ